MKKMAPWTVHAALGLPGRKKQRGKSRAAQSAARALGPAVCAENTAKCSHVKPVPPPQGLMARLFRRLDRPAGLGYNI